MSSTPDAARRARRLAGLGLRRLHRATESKGAGASGLSSLIQLCAGNAVGDTLVAVALAGTLFFNVDPGQARDKVALYLLITMVPFSVLAPLIGPLLDRWGHGRRLSLAATMLARAALCWALAGAHGALSLYPLALGLLVFSRAFSVGKGAVVPRVLPTEQTLVSANARLTLTGVLVGALVAPLGALISYTIGYRWVLRLGAVAFLGGVLLAMALPTRVDTAEGEQKAAGLSRATVIGGGPHRRSLGDVPQALRAATSLRALMGFLTLFLAFSLRGHHHGTAALAGLAASAGLGSTIGVVLGNRFSKRRPDVLLAMALAVAAVSCATGVVDTSVVSRLLVAVAVTGAAVLGKLALDAVIQRDTAPEVSASAFARSETTLQLGWVAGGALGLIPFPDELGLGLAALAAAVATVPAIVDSRHIGRRRRARPQGRPVA